MQPNRNTNSLLRQQEIGAERLKTIRMALLRWNSSWESWGVRLPRYTPGISIERWVQESLFHHKYQVFNSQSTSWDGVPLIEGNRIHWYLYEVVLFDFVLFYIESFKLEILEQWWKSRHNLDHLLTCTKHLVFECIERESYDYYTPFLTDMQDIRNMTAVFYAKLELYREKHLESTTNKFATRTGVDPLCMNGSVDRDDVYYQTDNVCILKPGI